MSVNWVDKSFQLSLYYQGDQVNKVQVHSRRPLEVQNLLVGRAPEEVFVMLPRVFPIGAKAHAQAAMLALNEAYGVTVSNPLQKARALLVHFEQAEQFVRSLSYNGHSVFNNEVEVLQQLAQLGEQLQEVLFSQQKSFFFGDRQPKQDTAALAEIGQSLSQLFEEQILGVAPGILGRLVPGQLQVWLNESAAVVPAYLREQRQYDQVQEPEIEPLGWISEPDWNKMLTSAGAAQLNYLPSVGGQCFETGAYARMKKKSVMQAMKTIGFKSLGLRVFAQVLDVSMAVLEVAKGLESQSPTAGTQKERGIGLAQVETGRGRLVHRVRVEADRIAQYQIIAPAEWNFHPKGVVASGLIGCRFSKKEGFIQTASQWVKAIDPFVEADIKMIPEDHLR